MIAKRIIGFGLLAFFIGFMFLKYRKSTAFLDDPALAISIFVLVVLGSVLIILRILR